MEKVGLWEATRVLERTQQNSAQTKQRTCADAPLIGHCAMHPPLGNEDAHDEQTPPRPTIMRSTYEDDEERDEITSIIVIG